MDGWDLKGCRVGLPSDLLGEGILRETDVALWTPTVLLLSCFCPATALDKCRSFWSRLSYSVAEYSIQPNDAWKNAAAITPRNLVTNTFD